jgi:hypothetical protein
VEVQTGVMETQNGAEATHNVADATQNVAAEAQNEAMEVQTEAMKAQIEPGRLRMLPWRLRWNGVCLDGALEAQNGAVEAYIKLRRLNLAVEGLSTIVADLYVSLEVGPDLLISSFKRTLATLKIVTSKPASGCLYFDTAILLRIVKWLFISCLQPAPAKLHK